MHTNRISPARKILLWLGATLALALLGLRYRRPDESHGAVLPGESIADLHLHPACDPQDQHGLPEQHQPENHSRRPELRDEAQFHGRRHLNEFEYQLPNGRDQIAYHHLAAPVQDRDRERTSPNPKVYTEIVNAKIVRRYVLSLEVNRGPIGARISVLGAAVSARRIPAFLEHLPARHNLQRATPNAISFFVPAVEANKNYRVHARQRRRHSPVGTFRVDPSNLSCQPFIPLAPRRRAPARDLQRSRLAPPGGLLIDVTTDVPESVIMPEIIVPQGQTSVTITVEGGQTRQRQSSSRASAPVR